LRHGPKRHGIDTDARDDTESTGHMALPLSSAAFGNYSHSDRDEDEDYDDDDDDDDDDEAGFSEDESLDESFFISSDEFDEFEWLEPQPQRKKKRLLRATRSLSDGTGSLITSTMTLEDQQNGPGR
jgi:hypothetical protein